MSSSWLLGFAAFLRYEEIAKLNCNDVEFFTNHVEIKIRSSKNDQLRQGDRVLVARSGKPTCPVAMLERLRLVKLLWHIVPATY